MDFLDEIAALKPVPAGGAACAYTANLGMALVYKVLLYELNRKELAPEPQANLRVAQREVERLYLDLKKLIADDPECYVAFSEAHRSGERHAAKAAFLDIVTCSMQVMEKALAGLNWVGILSRISSAKLAPHLRVAAELLGASLAGTAYVVRANLETIKPSDKRRSYLAKLDALYEQGVARKQEIVESL